MKLSKRSLAMMVAIVLCAATAIGSTFAFLQDETAEVANVMTVGNVTIDQHEDFVQDSPLFPTDNEEKKVKKEITVENTGKSPAYVRTLVSFEMGTMSEADFTKYVKWSYNDTDWTQGTPYVEGGRYVVPFTYNKELPVGETTTPSLQKVWLDKSAGNDQVEQLANGTGSYTVYALSQAVQTDGFSSAEAALAAAFGGAPVNVTNSNELKEAVNAASDTPVTIALSDGTYELPIIQNKDDRTFTGSKDAVIDMTDGYGAQVNGADSNITFSGVTIKYGSDNYNGISHAKKIVYKNCVIEGQMTNLAPEVEFIGCTFNASGDIYNIWTYGGEDVTFTDCVFNCDGKAVLVYNEETAASFVANVKLNDCTFNDKGGLTDAVKGAVETGSNANNTATSNKYNLTFTGCTVNGFAEDSGNVKTDSTYFGNKNNMDQDHLNVIIDGTDVY